MRTSKYSKIILLVTFAFIAVQACSDQIDEAEPVVVDFSDTAPIAVFRDSVKTGMPLHLAVASMISPHETLTHYDKLIKYISNKIKHPIKLEQHKTYEEVNSLIELMHIDVAFICSGAYVEAEKKFPIEILAVPVVNGKTTYNAYIIVHEKSSIQNFADLQGKSFAFTDPLSNTGRSYAVKRAVELGHNPNDFFSKIIYTHAHDYSIRAVSQGIAEAATVHSLIFDYLKLRNPDKVKNLRIIEKSEDFGMPPVVVHAKLDSKIKSELRRIFLTLDKDPEGKRILDQLLVEKYVPGNKVDYSTIRNNLSFIGR
ncbi:MAG: phosphate/phosphite/phosphonate ABC transporter substrate-binding protein [Calditrichaeota bacterium]|nr:MAG: phosphate/phosphite/phosphonate ABC transporter substrate-binding protein [Calditrichota bacterium]